VNHDYFARSRLASPSGHWKRNGENADECALDKELERLEIETALAKPGQLFSYGEPALQRGER
jgi:hypothetical protein